MYPRAIRLMLAGIFVCTLWFTGCDMGTYETRFDERNDDLRYNSVAADEN